MVDVAMSPIAAQMPPPPPPSAAPGSPGPRTVPQEPSDGSVPRDQPKRGQQLGTRKPLSVLGALSHVPPPLLDLLHLPSC